MGHTVQALALSIGRQRLIEALIYVVRVRLSPGSVEQVLPAVRPRGLAGHDYMEIGVLLVANPGHPRNLGPMIRVVTLGALAVEEDPRSLGLRLLAARVLCKERRRQKKRSYSHQGEEHVFAVGHMYDSKLSVFVLVFLYDQRVWGRDVSFPPALLTKHRNGQLHPGRIDSRLSDTQEATIVERRPSLKYRGVTGNL